MLREPTFEAPSLDNLKDAVLHWHTLSCELITPMYGGGTVSTKVDTKCPFAPAQFVVNCVFGGDC